MNGAAWRNQCHVCVHPERLAIECEIRAALANEGRVKGLKKIAQTWNLSYQSLLRHAGRKPPVPGRGEVRRSHLGAHLSASVRRCPKSFVDRLRQLNRQDLIAFASILFRASQANETEVSFSSQELAEVTTYQFTDNTLSLALSKLREHALIADFHREMARFRIQLHAPSEFVFGHR